jgi:hypothetical protein
MSQSDCHCVVFIQITTITNKLVREASGGGPGAAAVFSKLRGDLRDDLLKHTEQMIADNKVAAVNLLARAMSHTPGVGVRDYPQSSSRESQNEASNMRYLQESFVVTTHSANFIPTRHPPTHPPAKAHIIITALAASASLAHTHTHVYFSLSGGCRPQN